VFTTRCTAKLLKRIGPKLAAPEDIAAPTTALGDWHANLLFFDRAQALLFTNDNSRLAVVTPARDARNLGVHLAAGLAELLAHLGAPQLWTDAEVGEMKVSRVAPTRSRSILATMNDYAFQIEGRFHQWGGLYPLQMSLDLSGCPSGPLGYQLPYEVTLALLKERLGPE
jgi:hypothetical protein